jgi:hypothetical protein
VSTRIVRSIVWRSRRSLRPSGIECKESEEHQTRITRITRIAPGPGSPCRTTRPFLGNSRSRGYEMRPGVVPKKMRSRSGEWVSKCLRSDPRNPRNPRLVLLIVPVEMLPTRPLAQGDSVRLTSFRVRGAFGMQAGVVRLAGLTTSAADTNDGRGWRLLACVASVVVKPNSRV